MCRRAAEVVSGARMHAGGDHEPRPPRGLVPPVPVARAGPPEPDRRDAVAGVAGRVRDPRRHPHRRRRPNTVDPGTRRPPAATFCSPVHCFSQSPARVHSPSAVILRRPGLCPHACLFIARRHLHICGIPTLLSPMARATTTQPLVLPARHGTAVYGVAANGGPPDAEMEIDATATASSEAVLVHPVHWCLPCVPLTVRYSPVGRDGLVHPAALESAIGAGWPQPGLSPA